MLVAADRRAVTLFLLVQHRGRKGLEADERLKYYRMVQILLNSSREAYGLLFIPNLTVFIASNIVLGFYGIIKLHGEMELDKFMNFPIMVGFLLIGSFTFWPRNATIYERTKVEAISSMRFSIAAGGALKWKEMRCVLRSRPTLGVPFGSLYLIKRSTVLNFLDFVVCNTVSALITYP